LKSLTKATTFEVLARGATMLLRWWRAATLALLRRWRATALGVVTMRSNDDGGSMKNEEQQQRTFVV